MSVAAFLLALVPAPVLAQADRSELMKVCQAWHRYQPHVKACTALLKSGRLTPQQQVAVLRLRATGHMQAARFRLAIADYTEIIRLRPNDAAAYGQRARLRHRIGDDKGAQEDAGRALKLDPNEIWSLGLRGQANLSAGRYEPALRDFRRIIAVRPRSAMGYFMVATTYYRMKRYRRAAEYADQALERTGPWNVLWDLRIRIYVGAGDYRGGLRFIQVILDKDPRIAWLHHRAGEIYEKHLRDRQNAIARYRRAAALGHQPSIARLKALRPK